jgi:hypothetical protein
MNLNFYLTGLLWKIFNVLYKILFPKNVYCTFKTGEIQGKGLAGRKHIL